MVFLISSAVLFSYSMADAGYASTCGGSCYDEYTQNTYTCASTQSCQSDSLGHWCYDDAICTSAPTVSYDQCSYVNACQRLTVYSDGTSQYTADDTCTSLCSSGQCSGGSCVTSISPTPPPAITCAFDSVSYQVGQTRSASCGSGTCAGTATATCQSDGTWSTSTSCSTDSSACTTTQGGSGTCQSGTCVSTQTPVPNPTPTTGACTMTPTLYTDPVTLDNNCTVTIAHKAVDTVDGSGGKYKTISSYTGYRDVQFDDDPTLFLSTGEYVTDGGSLCNMDLEFSNTWTTSGNVLSITSARVGKNCNIFGLGCANQAAYGYTLTTGGSCSILSSFLCPVDSYTCSQNAGSGVKSNTILIKDSTQSFSTSFTIGECLSDLDCSISKGSGWSCGSNKICQYTPTTPATTSPTVPTLISPTDGSSVSTSNPSLYWSSVTGASSYKFYVRTASQAADSPTYGFCSSSNTGLALGTSLSTTYHWSAKACTDSSCSSCGSYASEFSFATPSTPVQTPCGTFDNPVDLGTVSSSAPLSFPTCSLSSSQTEDWFRISISDAFYLRATLYNATLSEIDWRFFICSTSDSACNDNTALIKSPVGISFPKSAVSSGKIGGSYLIRVERTSVGDGQGSIKLDGVECVENDIKDKANTPIGSSACVNLGKTCDTSVVEKTDPRYDPNRYARCNTPDINQPGSSLYSCKVCGGCNFNPDCTPNYCCPKEGIQTTGNIGPGNTADTKCYPASGSTSKIYGTDPKYLCTS
ncbi:MAG: hypothetical protein HYW23_01805 [Candidatus Aenigmarchaeota archaeon]|nr:hypothetical protein [Candidatus Aenigmarchaeota archaeon]